MDADERRKMLYAEFQLVDTDHDGVFTKQDLFRYLDRRNGGRVFDRGLANELFDQMEKDKDDRVTFNEFLNIWAESDRILRKRIAEDRMLIQNAQTNKKKLEENLNKLKGSRGTNTNPYLRLIIKEVRGIESERYVIAVQCLGQIFQTGAITSKNAIINFFMEFFAGAAPGEELTFKVLDLVNPAKAQQIGTFSIGALADQLKHDEWIILNRQDGVRSDSRVLVTMQHVVSEEKYYQNITAKWDQNIKELEEDIKKSENHIKQIESPNDFLLTIAYGDFYVQRLVPTQNLGTNHGIDGAYAVEQLPVPTTIHPLAKVSLIIGLLMLLSCLMLLFHRCDFPSATVALLLIGLFFLDRDNTRHGVKLTAGLNLVAFIMTITWLILYAKNFWGTQYIDAGTFDFGRKIEVVVTFVLLGLQFLTFVLLFQLHRIAVVKESKRSSSVLLPLPVGGGGQNMLQPMYGGASRANTNAMLSNMNTEGFFIEKPGGFVANTGVQQRPTGPGYQPPAGSFDPRGAAANSNDPFGARQGPGAMGPGAGGLPAGPAGMPPGPGTPPGPGAGFAGPTPNSTAGGR